MGPLVHSSIQQVFIGPLLCQACCRVPLRLGGDSSLVGDVGTNQIIPNDCNIGRRKFMVSSTDREAVASRLLCTIRFPATQEPQIPSVSLKDFPEEPKRVEVGLRESRNYLGPQMGCCDPGHRTDWEGQELAEPPSVSCGGGGQGLSGRPRGQDGEGVGSPPPARQQTRLLWELPEALRAGTQDGPPPAGRREPRRAGPRAGSRSGPWHSIRRLSLWRGGTSDSPPVD